MRTFYTGDSEHKGLSDQTGKPIVKPKQSSIRDHVTICGTSIPEDKFKIVATTNKENDLRFIRSNFIHKDKPMVNDINSSFLLR